VGIEAVLNHPVEGVLVWHVDRPHVAISTVQALLDRFRGGEEPIVVPSHEGRRGHPVIFGREVFEELLAAPEDQGARSVVRSDPSRLAVVPVDDPAVSEDIDTPEAYRSLLRREDTR
jgi:molybdenum cofactor cytidylyltransferase